MRSAAVVFVLAVIAAVMTAATIRDANGQDMAIQMVMVCPLTIRMESRLFDDGLYQTFIGKSSNSIEMVIAETTDRSRWIAYLRGPIVSCPIAEGGPKGKQR